MNGLQTFEQNKIFQIKQLQFFLIEARISQANFYTNQIQITILLIGIHNAKIIKYLKKKLLLDGKLT